jgi:hypothetical protein
MRRELSEKAIRAHDAVIVLIDSKAVELSRLPAAAIWQRLFRDASSRGPVSSLTSHITSDSIASTLLFCKASASPFELLTQAARAWKTVSGALPKRLLIATMALDAERANAAVEAIVFDQVETAAPAGAGTDHRVQHQCNDRSQPHGRNRSRQSSRTLAFLPAAQCAQQRQLSARRQYARETSWLVIRLLR